MTRIPASSSAEHAPQLDLEVLSSALPTELVADVLEYLSLDELWAAAQVSRQFYSAAWRAGLVIHRRLVLGYSDGYARRLGIFKDVLEQARRKNLRLSLAVESRGFGVQPEPSAYRHLGVLEVFPVITAALPFLVDLFILLPDCFRFQLDGALSCPAPLLRTLEFHYLLSGGPLFIPLQSSLFAGSAPQLQNVKLTNVALPDEPVTAFRSVFCAYFIYHQVFPPFAFGRHFPRLTTLRLDCRASDEHLPTPNSLDLAGLALRKLIVDDSGFTELLESVERSLDLSTIPHVLIIGDSVQWNDKVWTEDTSALSVRVSCCYAECAEVAIIVTPAHRRWQRLLYERDLGHYEPLPIGGMPTIGARMTYLRIECDFVRGFLDLQLTLPALRRIHVDIESRVSFLWALSPPGYCADAEIQSFYAVNCNPEDAPRVWAPCAALERITLFALNEPTNAVDSRGIAFLARALGQLERPNAERATLALIGVEFETPVAHDLLGEVVSEIRTSAFCGRGSCEDYDGGLWEHEFSESDRL